MTFHNVFAYIAPITVQMFCYVDYGSWETGNHQTITGIDYNFENFNSVYWNEINGSK